MRKLISVTLLTTTLTSGMAMAQEKPRNKMLDKMMYTISQDIQVTGPVFRDQNSKEERNKYGSEMVKLMLKEAHQKAKKYLEVDDTQGYYAFLTLALTVPLQEGLYIQYRGVNADVCNPAANNGELIKKVGESSYNNFMQYLAGGERPFIVPCENINPDKGLMQIIRGYDGSDLSVMQVSVRWHFDDFLANRKFENTVQTLNYGYKVLMDGFEPVYRNISDYECLGGGKSGGLLGGIFKKKKNTELDYTKIIRGVWAGKYNSGSIAKTCRFAETNSPYKHHDEGFEKNLNKVLNFNGSIGAGGDLEFTLDQDAAAAFKEVVTNLKNKTNERKSLEKVLSL